MGSLIKESNIKVKVYAADWENAISQAGEILMDCGSITRAYVDSMIHSVQNLGPYIVILPGFALAHAAPSKEVIKSDIGLITLKEPVCFGSENDPVRVVMCLACVDSGSHVEKLSKIAEILMEEEKVNQIADADSAEEIARMFWQH